MFNQPLGACIPIPAGLDCASPGLLANCQCDLQCDLVLTAIAGRRHQTGKDAGHEFGRGQGQQPADPTNRSLTRVP